MCKLKLAGGVAALQSDSRPASSVRRKCFLWPLGPSAVGRCFVALALSAGAVPSPRWGFSDSLCLDFLVLLSSVPGFPSPPSRADTYAESPKSSQKVSIMKEKKKPAMRGSQVFCTKLNFILKFRFPQTFKSVLIQGYCYVHRPLNQTVQVQI